MEEFLCYGSRITQIGCLSLLAGFAEKFKESHGSELRKWVQKFKLSLSLRSDFQKDKFSLNTCLEKPRDF